ncbi:MULTISPECIES: hypothetical protein [Microcoleaceae]|uniref:hypothetical protein n=1 Tax=Microcoleaceae TaxID=1892252 RepID=UPI0018818968|nr:hypothetical protein [Tychonema sp. LEGE 06208]MBE9165663.1 hypothetical protein [Tychonema sp. LEGE 06208]
MAASVLMGDRQIVIAIVHFSRSRLISNLLASELFLSLDLCVNLRQSLVICGSYILFFYRR